MDGTSRFEALNARISDRLDRDAEVEPRRVVRSPFVRFVCPVDHAAAKYDPTLWASLTFVGVQNVPADEHEPGFQLELVNCTCGTTLSKVIDAQSEAA